MQTNPLKSPQIRFYPDDDFSDLLPEVQPEATRSPSRDHNRPILATYVLVTLVALLAGYVLGQLSGQPAIESRAGWPSAPTNPRSLNP